MISRAACHFFQNLDDLTQLWLERLGHVKHALLERRFQRVLHLPRSVDVALRFERFPQRFGLIHAKRYCLTVGGRDSNRGELVTRNDPEPDACVVFDFLLQLFRELLVALSCDHRQRVDLKALEPLAFLIDAQPQATSDRLPPFTFGSNVAEGADLEHVRVVPTFAERRVREDEFERRVETQQLLFLFHDQVVRALGVVATGLIALVSVRPPALPVDREVAVVDVLGGIGQVHAFKQGVVIRMLRQTPVFLLEDQGVLTLHGDHRVAIGLVPTVPLDPFDEEERQHLDALRAQPFLFVQMFTDGPADHLTLDREAVHVAPSLVDFQKLLTAGHAQLEVLVALLDANLADAAIGINSAAGRLRQIVAVLHGDLLAPHAVGRLDVQLDPRADAALLLLAHGHQPDVRPVVRVLDRGRGDLNLLDQSLLIGVHRVEAVDHVVLVRMRGRVPQRAKRVHRTERCLAGARQTAVPLWGSSTIRIGRVVLIKSIGFSPPVFSLSLYRLLTSFLLMAPTVTTIT